MMPFADVFRAVAHALLDVVVCSVVFTVAALVVARIGGVDAGTRSRWWSAAAVVPLLAFVAALAQPLLVPAQNVAAVVAAAPSVTLVDPLDLVLRGHAKAGEGRISAGADGLAAAPGVVAPRRFPWLEIGIAVWFTVLVFRLVTVFRSAVRAHQLGSNARTAEVPCAQAEAGRQRIALRSCDGVETAVAIGLTHRLVIVPPRLVSELPPPELRAVILHEIAHLRRRDDWTYLAERLASAVLWFNPLVYFACHCAAHWREIACDASAAETAGGRTCATALWRSASVATPARPAAGLGFLSGNALVARVEALLAPAATSRSRSLAAVLALVLTASTAGAMVTVRAPAYAWPGARGLAPTGSMHVRRASFVAVKLRDGRVLVAGGMLANHDFTAQAELYDSTRGIFEPAGSLLDGRTGATGTLLPDGRVLVAGGWTSNGATDTSEIYDPSTGRFGAGPLMHSRRAGHTAVALIHGDVLLAGGVLSNNVSTASAELYESRRNAFVPVSPMHDPRALHTATVLADGRVLIAGGGDAGGSLRSTEIYDPATRKFTVGPQMSTPRSKQGAALLADGSVLIVGGGADNGWSSRLATSERYDPHTNSFVSSAPLENERFKLGDSTVRLANGDVLVAGGSTHVELYDAAANRFRTVGPPMDTARNLGAAVLLDDGSVLIAGGYASVDPLPTTQTALRYR